MANQPNRRRPRKPGTYFVHGQLDLPDAAMRRPEATWKVVLHPDGSADQYAACGTHTYHYRPEEDPAGVLEAWATLYRFRVRRTAV